MAGALDTRILPEGHPLASLTDAAIVRLAHATERLERRLHAMCSTPGSAGIDKQVAELVEAGIQFLDMVTPDADLECSLANTWGDDREGDDADNEPSLASPETPAGAQTNWARGGSTDRELDVGDQGEECHDAEWDEAEAGIADEDALRELRDDRADNVLLNEARWRDRAGVTLARCRTQIAVKRAVAKRRRSHAPAKAPDQRRQFPSYDRRRRLWAMGLAK